MSKLARRAALASCALALTAAASACGGGASASAPDPSAGLTLAVPSTLGGLAVTQDKKATAKLKGKAGPDTYVKDGQVYTLRLGTGPKAELKGVLQVIRLTPDARPEDREFRREIACKELLTGSCRQPIQIGNALVYKGVLGEDTPYEQTIYLWFTGRFMQTFVMRKDLSGTVNLPLLLDQLFAMKTVRV